MTYTGMLEEVGCIKELKKQKRENRKLKKRVEEAEGELTIIKGIGQNSPEMKAAVIRVKELDNSLSIALEVNDKYQRENEKLKEDLARAKEDHQYDNLVHQNELKSLGKK